MAYLSIYVGRYPPTETNPFSTELPAPFGRWASIGTHRFVADATEALIASVQVKALPKQWISQLILTRRMAIPTSSRRRQQLSET